MHVPVYNAYLATVNEKVSQKDAREKPSEKKPREKKASKKASEEIQPKKRRKTSELNVCTLL